MSDDNNQLAEYCVVLVEPNYHPQFGKPIRITRFGCKDCERIALLYA